MRIGIIGCGTIGTMLGEHFRKKGASIALWNRHSTPHPKAGQLQATSYSSLRDLAANSDLLLLAVKPYHLQDLHINLIGDVPPIVSVLSGASIAAIREQLGQVNVLRLMPNTAIRVGAGVVSLSEESKPHFADFVSHYLQGVGYVQWIPEALFNAATALAGCGPAYVLTIMEAMIDSGIGMGLPLEVARKLTIETVSGAAALLKAGNSTPTALRWEITVPKGMTAAGSHELERYGARTAIHEAFLAAYSRGHG